MNFVNCKRLHLLVNYISWERKIEIPFYHPLKLIHTATVVLLFLVQYRTEHLVMPLKLSQ